MIYKLSHRDLCMYEHLAVHQNIIEETKSLLYNIYLKNVVKSKKRNNKVYFCYSVDTQNSKIDVLKNNLSFLYFDVGCGFKLLCKIFDNKISYTNIRSLFKKLDIESRKGLQVITDSLKQIRSQNAKDSNNWSDWTKNHQTLDSKNKHHLCGWYESKQGFDVYLRSSWEYAYAVYLDKNDKKWKYEEKSFLLSDKRIYRPDFFIYDAAGRLEKIVEIKSKWFNGSLERIDKFLQFSKEYSQYKTELITDNLFDLIDTDIKTVLKEWKSIRIKNVKRTID